MIGTTIRPMPSAGGERHERLAGGAAEEVAGPERLDDLGQDEGDREEADRDGRDPGEDLEDRLDRLAHPRAARTRSGRSPTPSPIGIANSIAQSVTLSVPTTIASTPKLGGSNCGVQSVPKRNSPIGTTSKKPIVGPIREMTIAVVVSTERTAQKARRPWMTFSP